MVSVVIVSVTEAPKSLVATSIFQEIVL